MTPGLRIQGLDQKTLDELVYYPFFAQHSRPDRITLTEVTNSIQGGTKLRV